MGLQTFCEALENPDIQPPAGIVGPNGKKAVKRFNVYRNNVVVGLTGALSDTFPAIGRLVGEEFFNAMARVYIAEEPPTSPLLFEYGSGFPQFLERFEPVAHLPYLPDVARLERFWLDAYHAADAPCLTPDVLGAVAPENLALQQFIPHPATRILRSQFAAVTIFSANRLGGQVPDIDPTKPEDGLITRVNGDIEIRHLPAGAAVFFTSLMSGETLGTAAEKAATVSAEFDLSAAISAMLEAGVFAGLQTSSVHG